MQGRRRRSRWTGVLATMAGLLFACVLIGLMLVWLLTPPGLPVPPQGFALSGLTLVEPGRDPLPGRTIRVRGSRIVEIVEAPEPEASDAFEGSWVLPGLVDLHVHHPPALALGQRELFGLLFLRHGVTSVRDTGSFDGRLLAYRERVALGDVASPRIFACGSILDGDPPGWPGALVVRDAEDAKRAVATLAGRNVDCVKIYNGIEPQSFAAIRDAASSHGLPLVAHVPFSVPFQSIEGAEVQHLMGLAEDWEASSPRAIDRYVQHSVRAGLRHTPTLVVYARAARLEDHSQLARDPVGLLLPRLYRELLWNPARNPMVFWLSPGGFGGLSERYALMRRVVRDLHGAGVPLLVGTDTMNPFVVPGASLQEELVHLAEAGLGLEAAWAAATRQAGEVLGVPGLGTLQVGAPADFVLFREDPSRDPAAFDTLQAVVADGRLYTRQELDAAIARQLAHFDGGLYAPLFEGVARLVIGVVGSSTN